MKQLLSIALATLLFVACEKQSLVCCPDNSERSLSLNACIENDGSKTYLDATRTVLWGKDEYMMLYFNDGSSHFVKSQPSSASAFDGKPSATFDFAIKSASASSYSFGGVYPASAVVGEGGPEAYKVSLPSFQRATPTAYDSASYIMALKPQTETSVPEKLTGYFRRMAALCKLTLHGVPDAVNSVEITVAGKALAGGCSIDLTHATLGDTYAGKENIIVSFSEPVPAGEVDVWFNCWPVEISSGETVTIKVSGSTGSYAKSITAGATGISFKQGMLNTMGVDFSSVTPGALSMADFAVAFSSLLDVWTATSTNEKTVGNATFSGHYIPAGQTVSVAGKTYSKAQSYDIALQGLVSLYNGSSLDMAIPTPGSYGWGGDPYNELPGNGGVFTMDSVDLDFLRNYTSRQQSWASSNSSWANMCGYVNSSKGTPVIIGSWGCCCLERHLLMMARFYRYLLENNIKSNIASGCTSMRLSSALYEIPSEPEPGPEPGPGPEPSEFKVTGWNGAYVKAMSDALEYFKTNDIIPTSISFSYNGTSYTLNRGQYLCAAYVMLPHMIENPSNWQDNKITYITSVTANKSKSEYDHFDTYRSDVFTLAQMQSICSKLSTYVKNNSAFPNYCTMVSSYKDSDGSVYDQKANILQYGTAFVRFFNYYVNNSCTMPSSVSSWPSDYLRASTNCKIGDSVVVNAMKSATNGCSTDYDKARGIFNYVRKFTYQYYDNTSRGAVGTINDKKGNCCDQAHTVVAMARAAGIPARYRHAQCRYNSGTIYGHLMAEVFADGRWILCDCTGGTDNTFDMHPSKWTLMTTFNGLYISLEF